MPPIQRVKVGVWFILCIFDALLKSDSLRGMLRFLVLRKIYKPLNLSTFDRYLPQTSSSNTLSQLLDLKNLSKSSCSTPDFAMDSFPGVKQTSGSKAFYYDDRDINMIDVPVGECQGDYILSKADLKRYFGLDPSRMGKLPEYFIAPRLDSAHNDARSTGGAFDEIRAISDVTGEVVAYKPLEWIPSVHARKTIPYNHFKVEFEKTETTIKTAELYGKFEASFTISAAGGWKSIKAELSSTSTFEASYKITTESKEEIKTKGNLGDVVVKELVMGMSLRVRRVYERSVHMYFGWKVKNPIGDAFNFKVAKMEPILTWDGPESWDDIRVKSSALRDVKPLQFFPVPMTGNGYKDGLWLQVLPVFNDKKLTDMHLVVSANGWDDWAAYTHGSRTVDGDREETLPMPDYITPLVTHIAVSDQEDVSAKKSTV